MAPTVSAIKTEDYSKEAMRRAVRRHMEALDACDIFRLGVRVVLKPNLLLKRSPDGGTTTHPALVHAVAEQLLEWGIKAEDIVIADSPGGPYTRTALEGIYAATGMKQVAEETGVHLNFSTGHREVTSCTLDGLCSTFSLIEPVVNADVVINLPKLKTHAMTTLSCGVKNLFGCVPGLQKPELHFRFPQGEQFGRMLVELAQLVHPQLTIVDAVVAMEGDGPSAGELRQMGWTFASRDLHAMDLAICQVIGLDAQTVPTLCYAVEAELAPKKAEEVEFVGDGRPEITPFRVPQSRELNFGGSKNPFVAWFARRFGKSLLAPRPVIRRKACIGCGKCAESCPANTITIKKHKAEIDYKKCINCYCCHEMCPVKCIGIRRFWLLERL